MNPTEQQRIIIEHTGSAVVIASPGSGKTFVISQKIKQNLHVLHEHEGIIAISYTNKASNKLKKRSLSNGENPMCSFFGTIDKFFISEIIIPFGKQLFGKPSNDIQIIRIDTLSAEEGKKIEWFTRDIRLNQLSASNISLLKEYFLKGSIFIETVGILASYVFSKSNACQKYLKARYKFIYVDEYQDSGFEQHQLFLKIKELGANAVAVGDLNQSIYEFSGKSSMYLKELSENNDLKYFKLDKNHRCHPSIINYSNYLLNPRTELIENVSKLILFRRLDGAEISIAKWIDKNIAKIKTFFGVGKLNEIAILTKSNRTATIINENLSSPHKYSITSELDNNLNVWSGIFSHLLYYVLDNKHKFSEVIDSFTSYDKMNRNELKQLKELKGLLGNFFTLNTDLNKKTFIDIAKIIAPNSENIESVKLLSEVLESQSELDSYKAPNDNEITIMTLHKSKGLEFDVIIHLDLHEWVFPTKGPGPNKDFKNPQYFNWEQDINLHYVGITRARKGCILVSSTERTNPNGEIKKGNDSEFIGLNGIEKLRCDG